MSTDSQTRRVETTMTTAAGTDASFGALKQIDAGLLSVGYAEAGPADSPAVILLHGWPYDIHSYVAVARHRSSDHRRLRLRSANSRGHGGPLAGAVTGDRIGERLPDR
jgi:pimeloyl-ACP methyl ester carboxylesterase